MDSAKVFFSAGEASGDAYAAELAHAFRAVGFATLAGIGSRRSEAAGVRLVADSSSWGAVGIVESLRVVPRVAEGGRAAGRFLKRGAPGLFVPIDYGFLNVRLCRAARGAGWRVLYFVPPGSWRRDKQGGDLPRLADSIVTPFPWSAEILQGMGADAHFFGHPLKEMVARVPDPGGRAGVAVLPGSRAHEVERNVPALVGALRGLPGPARIAVAANLEAETVARIWRSAGGGEAEFRPDTYCVLKSAQAALVCSGTATLEAALCDCPTVVVYRGSRAMEIEYRIRRPKFSFISLPNILLGRRVLPELIQQEASPEAIRAELLPLLAPSPERDAQLTAFLELEHTLGQGDCFGRTAALARAVVDRADPRT